MEYHRQIFDWASGRIRAGFEESSWRAFWLTTVEQRDGKEVAEMLGLSIGAVYVAKSRVLARLRAELRELDADDSRIVLSNTRVPWWNDAMIGRVDCPGAPLLRSGGLRV